MEIKEAIAILARIQEPEAWEPQITRKAWQALEMAKEALVKESQGLAKDLVKDLPDTKVGNCSEIPNSSDLIGRQNGIGQMKSSRDLIDRTEAQTELQFAARRYTVAHEAHGEGTVVWSDNLISLTDAMNALRKMPPAEAEPKWIPIKWHNCTNEDREKYGFSDDIVAVFDNEMPDDNQEILITTSHGYVEKDICYIDEGFSLDSGYDWIDDVKAWKPLSKPYKAESEG